MEARKITIVSTKTQRKSVIMSSAETLAELKNDLTRNNIDYEDMTFYEGTSKTELKTDESILPKDVPYVNRTTGETIITNELVFMLTNTNKKIRSGAVSRLEIYASIKNMNLQDAVKKTFGKNFTQCSTQDLLEFINKNKAKKDAKSKTPVKKENKTTCKDMKACDAVARLVDILLNDGCIDSEEYNEIIEILGNNTSSKPTSSYSNDEIDAMFEGMY